MKVEIRRETEVSRSPRARQLEAMFDVPARDKIAHEWVGDLPVDEKPWQVGLIVGPSGSGKSTLLTEMFGQPIEFDWGQPSVVDDFSAELSMDDISKACQAVGFNTIPSWLKPHEVLSTGEQFRVSLARALLESSDRTVVDEFTSVVDRQVAQIGAHAVAKFIRRNPSRQFVAASCHYDIVDWLQPDWIIEPHKLQLTRRSVQSRPALDVCIYRTTHETWGLFAPFHYLTAELHRAAACFVLCVGDQPASFTGILHRPVSRGRQIQNVKGMSRMVTLPDWQGLGLAFVLSDHLASAYKAIGQRLRYYPAHPSFIRSCDRSPNWALISRPGQFHKAPSASSTLEAAAGRPAGAGGFGGRPNATFEYCGPAMNDTDQARQLIAA